MFQNKPLKVLRCDTVPGYRKNCHGSPAISAPEILALIVSGFEEDKSECIVIPRHSSIRIYDRLIAKNSLPVVSLLIDALSVLGAPPGPFCHKLGCHYPRDQVKPFRSIGEKPRSISMETGSRRNSFVLGDVIAVTSSLSHFQRPMKKLFLEAAQFNPGLLVANNS